MLIFKRKEWCYTGDEITISRKISEASKIREDSNYDDEYKPTDEETKTQIETAKELIELVNRYLDRNNKQ
ncbi:MAG: HEPN domain-containing protein [Clostridia bacterium]|nr:HEPN domain-containing protein [Clostridia bacterium]